jgi:hypothetical protein
MTNDEISRISGTFMQNTQITVLEAMRHTVNIVNVDRANWANKLKEAVAKWADDSNSLCSVINDIVKLLEEGSK